MITYHKSSNGYRVLVITVGTRSLYLLQRGTEISYTTARLM